MRKKTQQLAKKELRREKRELTLRPVLNEKTSLDVQPWMPEREQIAQQAFYHRIAKGKQITDYMDKALDLRNVEQMGRWYPSNQATSRSRSGRRGQK